MITVICTTDRQGSNTRKATQLYLDNLYAMGETVQLLDIKDVKLEWIARSNYGKNCTEFEDIITKYIRSVDKMILIVPEYNGSFPGLFKFFIDACDQHTFRDKKLALMGLAAGRSGNVRGIDHLTGVLHYLGAEVYSKKVYLSLVNLSLSASGQLENETLENEIREQMKGFLAY